MNQPPKTRVFLEGRYKKLTRDLPQTIFYCPECKGHRRRRQKCERCEGFGKLSRDSVQELVAWVACKAFGTRKQKFHGAGREDVDVRMLGHGRPFVLELSEPKEFDVDLAELEAEINRRNEGRLEIHGLHWSEKGRVRILKEEAHAKEYEALVTCEEAPPQAAIDALVGQRLEIVQRTPGRVAHRRADLERKRWVEFRAIEPAETPEGEGARFRVRMRTQHGTYVKEVLNGDGGNTQPNVAEMFGTPCSCVELDVTAILDEEGSSEKVPAEPPKFGAGI